MDGIQIRHVSKTVEVDLPKVFMIGGNSNEKKRLETKSFEVCVKELGTEPMKEETRLGELKNKITPIEKIWTSHIKQFLNDSEFV